MAENRLCNCGSTRWQNLGWIEEAWFNDQKHGRAYNAFYLGKCPDCGGYKSFPPDCLKDAVSGGWEIPV